LLLVFSVFLEGERGESQEKGGREPGERRERARRKDGERA